MAVYDRWHKTHPHPDERPCEHSRGRSRLYPTAGHGKGMRWQVRWYDETGRQCKANRARKGGQRDESDPDVYAEALDAKIQSELNTGNYVAPAGGRTKLGEYAEKWRADLLHRDSTADRMDRVFRLHIDPILGEIPIARVKPSNLRAWVKDRDEVLAPSTLAVAYSYLASMFASAVIDRDIGVSPCAGIRLPDIDKHPHYIPTPEQVHTLAESLTWPIPRPDGKHPARRVPPRPYTAVAYTAAGCGLRGGEIFGLELNAVDFLRREIDVRQQLKCDEGRPPYLGPPKTRTSARTVEMPEVTALALSQLIERFPPVEIDIDDETDPRRPVRRRARLLFVTSRLNPVHRATWSQMWAPARDAAGIPAGVGLHALRHYFATLLIHKGASVKTVQLALGHSTPMITLNEYVGEWPEVQEKTRTLVDAALGRVPRMCPTEIGVTR